MNGIKHFYSLFFLACFTYGCGGGGKSGNNSTNIKPTTEAEVTVTIPISKAEINKKYSGKRNAASIDELNLKSITNDILYWKDFLRILASGAYGLEHPNNIALKIPYTPEKTCQSGSIDEPKLDDIKSIKPEYTVTYSDCAIGNLVANGKLTLRVVGNNITNNEIDYFQIEMDKNFSIYDSKLKQYFTIVGIFNQASSSDSYNIDIEVSNEIESKLLIVDGLIDSENKINNGRVYIAEFGYIDIIDSNVYQGKNRLSIESERRNDQNGSKDYLSITFEPIDGVKRYGITDGKINLNIANNLTIKYEDFSLLDTSIDIGPTKAKFAGQNIIYEKETINLDIFSSESPDLNFVTILWQIEDINNTIIFESQEISEEYTFSTSGTYNVSLFINDSFANQYQYSENVHVLLQNDSLALEANINVISELSSGTSYHATIDVSNTNFSYSIAYGPEGLTIDSEGNIQWSGTPENHLLANQINYGITVTNNETGQFTILTTGIKIAPENIAVKSYNNFNSNYFDDSNKHQLKAIDDKNGLMVLSHLPDGNYKTIKFDNNLLQVEPHYLPLLSGQALSDIHYSSTLQTFDFLIRETETLSSNEITERFYRYSNLNTIIEEQTNNITHGKSHYLLPLDGESDLEFFGAKFNQISLCDFFPGGKKELISTDSYGSVNNAILHYWQAGLKNQFTLPNKAYEFIGTNNDERCDYLLGYSSTYANGKYNTTIEKFQWRNNSLEKLSSDLLINIDNDKIYWPYIIHPENNYGGILVNQFVNSKNQWLHVGVDDLSNFITSEISATANLGINLSPENSQFRASLDLNNDGKKEWVFLHKITKNDPIFEKLGYHNEHDRAHSIIVAAKLKENNLVPLYTSAIAVDNASSLSTFSNGDLVFGNGKLPIVMDSSSQFKKGFGHSDITNNQAYYVFEDGKHYQLQDSTLSLIDNNLNEVWSFIISDHITDIVNISSIDRITVHDTYNDNIDFITLNDHWVIINRATGDVVGQQIHNWDNFSLHPSFSQNGLVFLYPPEHQFIENNDGYTTQSPNISGVYEINNEELTLKYNWRESVFAKVNIRVHSFNWLNIDNDAEMEIVAYFTKEQDHTSRYYYYFADIEGGQVTVKSMQLENLENPELVFSNARSNNNRCFEPSCKVVLLENGDGNIVAIDKLTGKDLWLLDIDSDIYDPWIGKNNEVSFNSINTSDINHRFNSNYLFHQ